jgi:hypothetical protein
MPALIRRALASRPGWRNRRRKSEIYLWHPLQNSYDKLRVPTANARETARRQGCILCIQRDSYAITCC